MYFISIMQRETYEGYFLDAICFTEITRVKFLRHNIPAQRIAFIDF